MLHDNVGAFDAYIITQGGPREASMRQMADAIRLKTFTIVRGIRAVPNLTECTKPHAATVSVRKPCGSCIQSALQAWRHTDTNSSARSLCYGWCDFTTTYKRLVNVQGTRLAHLATWQAVAAGGRDAVVFEDDAELASSHASMGSMLQQHVHFLQRRAYDFGFLGSCFAASCCATAFCLHAYFLTPTAASQLLNFSKPCMPADVPTYALCASTLRCHSLNEVLFRQDERAAERRWSNASARPVLEKLLSQPATTLQVTDPDADQEAVRLDDSDGVSTLARIGFSNATAIEAALERSHGNVEIALAHLAHARLRPMLRAIPAAVARNL